MKSEILHKKRDFANVRELIEWAGEEYSDRIPILIKCNRAIRKKRKYLFPL